MPQNFKISLKQLINTIKDQSKQLKIKLPEIEFLNKIKKF